MNRKIKMPLLNQVITNLKTLEDTLQQKIDNIIEEVSQLALIEFKALWPSDTGQSSNQWTIVKTGNTFTIVNNSPYAEFVHNKGSSQILFKDIYDPLMKDKYIPILELKLKILIESEIEKALL